MTLRAREYNILSVYYKAVLGRMIIFGEGFVRIWTKNQRWCRDSHYALPTGLISTYCTRSYDSGIYQLSWEGPFFSSSAGDNVRGLFANFTFEAAKHLFLSAGCDLRYYPWLKYRCSAPSLAKSSEIRIKYLPSEKLLFEASWNYRFQCLMSLNRPGSGNRQRSSAGH